jgi:hypothetical protein
VRRAGEAQYAAIKRRSNALKREMDLPPEAAAHRTLEDVLHWRRAALVEVIVQDELTHDVVFAVDDFFLVYDTT